MVYHTSRYHNTKNAYDEQTRIFDEYQTVETVLRNQIVKVIAPEYLQSLRNATTDMLNDSILNIFRILITIYDEFSPSEFKERKLQVDDMIYNPSLTTDTISNKIQEYQNLCILLANP